MLRNWIQRLNQQFAMMSLNSATRQRRRTVRHPVGALIEQLEDRTLLSAPEFSQDSYAFAVPSDVAEFAVIGNTQATDADGDMLSFFGGAGPFFLDSNGGIIFGGPTGAIAAGEQYDFTATVDDGMEGDTAEVTLQIYAPNSPPVFSAANYQFDVSEDVAAQTVIAMLPATDADADLLIYSGGTDPFYVGFDGALIVADTQHVLTAGDTFTFMASVDDQTDIDTATVQINIVGTNIPVDAIDDNTSGEIGSTIVIDVLANDLGSGLSIQSAFSNDGVVNLVDSDSDGDADLLNLLVSDPNATSAQIQYTAQDSAGNADGAVALVALQAPAANTTPRFVQSPYVLQHVDARIYTFDYYVGAPTVGPVFAYDPDTNHTDPNLRDVVTYRLSGNSDFKIRPDGIIEPKRAFSLIDVIQPQLMLNVTATDQHGASDDAGVWINIKRPVKAIDDAFQLTTLATETEVESTFSVLTNDMAAPGRTRVETRQNPAHGTITWDPQNLGFFKYKANDNDPANFPNADSFKYRLVDIGVGDVSVDVTVSLSFVTPAQPTLIAVDDVREATIDVTKTVYEFDGASDSVVMNDTFPTGTSLLRLDDARFGTVALDADGTFTYTVNSIGVSTAITDSFTYRLKNGTEKSIGRVDIRFSEPTPAVVNPITQAPPRFSQSYFVFTFQELSAGQAIVNATDPNGDVVTIKLIDDAHPPWVKGVATGPGAFKLEYNNLFPPPEDGLYTFWIEVTDNQFAADGSLNLQKDYAVVYIFESTAGNQSPVFQTTNAGGPNLYTVTVDPATLVGSNGWVSTGKTIKATDPIGDPISYMIVAPGADPNYSSPVFVNPGTGEILVSRGLWETVGGVVTQEFDVLATDEDHHMAMTKLKVTVNLANYTAKLFVQGQGDTTDIAGNDVIQGTIGDCWFISVLGGVADRSPQLIRSMIQVQNGQYQVRLFRRQGNNLNPVWISVSYDLAGDAGAAIGADIDAQNQVEIWVRVVERAFIQFMGGASYVSKVNFDRAAAAWEMITGYPAIPMQRINNDTEDDIRDAIDDGKLVWIATKNLPVLPAGLVGQHVYQIVGFVDPNRTTVRLRNPHGSNDVTIALSALVVAIDGWWTE